MRSAEIVVFARLAEHINSRIVRANGLVIDGGPSLNVIEGNLDGGSFNARWAEDHHVVGDQQQRLQTPLVGQADLSLHICHRESIVAIKDVLGSKIQTAGMARRARGIAALVQVQRDGSHLRERRQLTRRKFGQVRSLSLKWLGLRCASKHANVAGGRLARALVGGNAVAQTGLNLNRVVNRQNHKALYIRALHGELDLASGMVPPHLDDL